MNAQGTLRRWLPALLLAAALAPAASAGDKVLRVVIGTPGPAVSRYVPGHYEVRTEKVLVEPGHWEERFIPEERVVTVDRRGWKHIIIKPARCERVWVEPRYTCRTVRVWVPGRFEYTPVRRVCGCRRTRHYHQRVHAYPSRSFGGTYFGFAFRW